MSDSISNVVRVFTCQVKPLLHALHSKVRFASLAVAVAALLLGILIVAPANHAQTELAGVYGRVTDASGAVIVDAEVEIKNTETGISTTVRSNQNGLYTIPSLHPGQYLINVRKPGFQSVTVTDLTLNVQDNVVRNFALKVGSIAETVTVRADDVNINTMDASVSTVVDRNFAENLPMNGRSFQALVELTPGVVVVPTNVADQGQFSVNGQRAASNYWMVDGVSANIGVGVSGPQANENGLAGVNGSFSALGGTNSLVSVDAMQEFRIQTSTYAPEFGRTPGAQISIVTRSGANQFHGTVFDYLRNDALDANNWFNGFVTPAVPKPKERQNDFGGTFSGPIFKDHTFFFFSYEGLRLRLPETVISTVPDMAARQGATPAMQPFLNAFPLPNGSDNPATGVAQFNSSFSSSSSLDAASLRIDHRLKDKVNLFARYNYSPSEVIQRGGGLLAPSVVTPTKITTQTGTVGATWSISPIVANDLRFNYSRTNANGHSFLDNFGGAVPLGSLPFPSPFTAQNGQLRFNIFGVQSGLLTDGVFIQNVQRQINLVDSISVQKGSHSLKFGVDFRRLSPVQRPVQYSQLVNFGSVARAERGSASSGAIQSRSPAYLLFRNLGAFAQDTWRVTPSLTLTYGLRWDVDFAASTLSGPSLPAVTGFNANDLSQLAIAPAGTPPFTTSYGNVGPRIGIAYQLGQNPNRPTVLRGGFGIFYDFANVQTGVLAGVNPPFGRTNSLFGAAAVFPFSAASSAPPVIPPAGTLANVLALNPDLKLPYTLQWNVALEQALGRQQALTLSYVGAAGRRLLQTTFLFFPPSNPNIGVGQLVDNSATSDYDALQVQFERRLSRGLQALVSYSWAHSIDTASASSVQIGSNENIPGGGNINRGSSDFDVRHTLSLGVTYEVPAPAGNLFMKSIVRGWSLQSAIQARSAPPVDVSDGDFFTFNTGFFADIRPDVVPGQALYLFGTNCAAVMHGLGNLSPGQGCPGGKALNPAAFADPPTTPAGCNPAVDLLCNPARQGNVGRNALRGFGATQWDFAVHRDFPIHESVKLQFRAEMFNVLNHPNFGQPVGTLLSPSFGGAAATRFGLSNQTLNQSLAGTGVAGTGGFNPLYQIGGPRSIQLALKLVF